jgi:hypothetical protein
MRLIPPKWDMEREDTSAWPRGGVRGLLFGGLIGLIISAVAFWLVGGYWWFLCIPSSAWVGYSIRLPPKGAKLGMVEPPNVLW